MPQPMWIFLEELIMKKLLVLFIVFMLVTPGYTQAQNDRIALLINGSYVTEGAPPVIINGRTYIPLRNLFENIEFTVEYSPKLKEVAVWFNRGPFIMKFKLYSNNVTISSLFNSGSKSINTKISNTPILYKGSVYVPIRAFAELFNADVNYEWANNTVTFNASTEQIRTAIYPKIGIEIRTGQIEEKRVKLSANEIGKLMDRIGLVNTFDNQNNPISQGSGFILPNNLFITNYHVINGSSNFAIDIDDKKIFNDKYLFMNPEIDLFGVILDGEYKFLKYNTGLPEVGDKVYAIGSPNGLENTLTEGIVSSIRSKNGNTLIQHTADIDHGSSGGPLLNEYGEVIGINSSGFPGTQYEFAIPIEFVFKEIEKLKQ